MNNNLKIIASLLILAVGLFFFLLSMANNKFNFALISISTTLIFWVLYSLMFNSFNIRIFSWIISCSGFLVAIGIFVIFGIEEVPYPAGAIIFHSDGFAAALSIAFLSFFPLLFSDHSSKIITNEKNNYKETTEKPTLMGDDWEVATDDDVLSDDFDLN